jgi:hypothetical protein
MGMIGVLHWASEADLQRLRGDPGLLASFFGEEEEEGEEVELPPPPPRPGFLARLFGRGAVAAPHPTPAPEPSGGDDDGDGDGPWDGEGDGEGEGDWDGEGMHVDKAWHGLHYLFTGTVWEGEEPACYLVEGGEALPDDRYGNVRIIRPAQVERFAAFLRPLTREALLDRYDPEDMLELDIYPRMWRNEDAFEYLWVYFQDLRAFVATAAERRAGLVIHIG